MHLVLANTTDKADHRRLYFSVNQIVNREVDDCLDVFLSERLRSKPPCCIHLDIDWMQISVKSGSALTHSINIHTCTFAYITSQTRTLLIAFTPN